MEIKVPEWLTESFIKDALENGRPENIKIRNMNITKPIPKGNNYSCIIYGAAVEYEKLEMPNQLYKMNLIVKAPHEGGMSKDLIEIGMLQKESMFYNILSDKIKNIILRACPNEEHILAESFVSSRENIIILEDLKVKGYKMTDRLKRFDFEHASLALKTLAKYHSVSVVLYEEEPTLVKQIGKEVLFHEDLKNKFDELFKNLVNAFANGLKKWPETEKYAKWFHKIEDTIYDKLVESVKPENSGLNVLNHGDFWLANMLFKYDDNEKPLRVIPVDFQIARYTSPAIDFLYFTTASVQENIRSNHYEDFIRIYLGELNANLKKFGCSKSLSEEEFKISLKERAYFSLIVTIQVLPIIIANPDEIELMDIGEMSIEDFRSRENNPIMRYLKNDKLGEIFCQRLKEFENSGLISLS